MSPTLTLSPLNDVAALGRYRLLSILGSGRGGLLIRARDPHLGRPVAVKLPAFDPQSPGASDRRTRFLREVRVAAGITHLNLCPIADLGEEAGRPFVVRPLVDGKSLEELFRPAAPRFPRREAVRIVREVAHALTALHARSVVHGALCPGNILIDGAGRAIVTDYGLGSLARGAPTDYLAPEQLAGRPAGPTADVHALGVVLHKLLSSPALPRGGEPEAASDPVLDEIVRRATATELADRFDSAETLATALDAWLVTPPEPRPGPPKKILAGAGLLGGVFSVLLLASACWRSDQLLTTLPAQPGPVTPVEGVSPPSPPNFRFPPRMPGWVPPVGPIPAQVPEAKAIPTVSVTTG